MLTATSLISGVMEGVNIESSLAARAYHHLRKLACTIAILAACEEILCLHLAEALQYRLKLMIG
jgi:predicted ATPase with chaperone activity